MSRIIELEISCCGECLYYNITKHECRKGAKDEGAPNDRFYKDCPLTWREADLDELVKEMTEGASEKN